MTRKGKVQLQSEINTNLANNTSRDISAQDVRDVVTNITDTMIFPGSGVVADFDTSAIWPVTNGGTGSSSASGARTNLGLVISTNVQAYDAQLDTLAALTANQVGGLVDLATLEAPASDGQFIVATGAGVFAYESTSTARTSLGLGTVSTLDTGISNTNVAKFNANVVDNDFLRVDGTAIEGRSASEVLTDIAAAPAAGNSSILTVGALAAGSIASGFGNITTTGTIDISGGTLTVAADGISGDKIHGGTISGNVALGDGATATTQSSSNNSTKIATTAYADAAGGGGGGTITALNNATENELVTVGSTTTELDAESALTFTSNVLKPTVSAHNVAGTVLTVSAGSTTAGTTNDIAGAALTFTGGQGKGTGAGGDILFKTATPAGTTGTVINSLVTALTISDDLSATFAGVIELGHATDTTLARSGSGDVTIEGNAIYRAGGTDVPVTDGGTGASSASSARTNLGVDAAGVDNSTNVTLVTSSHDYLSISTQAITLGAIDLAADVTGTLPVGSVSTITLGTNTAGNYVATVTGGTGITSTGATSGQGIAHSLSVDASQTGITAVGTLVGLTLDGDKAITPGDGSMIHLDTSTLTADTAGSGTAAKFASVAFEAPTLAATNASVTTTDATTVYISAAPSAGTNQTLTRSWALWIDAGNLRYDGSIYAGTTEALSSGGLVTVSNQSNITGVGTISSGTWEGATVAVDQGGTGQTSYTNGQLLIGNTTGNTLTKATLTAGSNISITNGTGTISIAATDTNTTYTKASFDLDHLFTLVGASADTDEHLGTFTGSTITDGSRTIKQALQDLETAVETKTSNTGDMTGVDLTAGTGITIDSEANTGSGDYSATITCTVTDTNTTYSAATSSALGLMKLEDDTDQTTAANAVSTTAGRTYGVQFNSSDQAVVNVPWVDTDTDTTYTKASFDLDHLFTLVDATADTSEHLGTFTGSTISDSVTIKAALQALETAVETKGTGTVDISGTPTAGHVAIWSDADTITFDSAQLFWDTSSNELGVGTGTPGSTLDVSGSVGYKPFMISSTVGEGDTDWTSIGANTYEIGSAVTYLVETGATARTIELPDPSSSIAGRTYTIKKIDSGDGTVTIQPYDAASAPAGGYIDGDNATVDDGTNILFAQYDTISATCAEGTTSDQYEWHIIQEKVTPHQITIRNSVAQSITNVWEHVEFQDTDAGGVGCTFSTSTDKITIARAGRYVVSFKLGMDSGDNIAHFCGIAKNQNSTTVAAGDILAEAYMIDSGGEAYSLNIGSCTVTLAKGDTLNMLALNDSAKSTRVGSANNETIISVTEIV